jgi:MarR family
MPRFPSKEAAVRRCANSSHVGVVPKAVRKGSVLVQLAAAYFHSARRMEQKTRCWQTRGFVLATLRGGAPQNQIATLLGVDRTVVHRTVKSLIRERLVSERKAPSGRTLSTAGTMNR